MLVYFGCNLSGVCPVWKHLCTVVVGRALCFVFYVTTEPCYIKRVKPCLSVLGCIALAVTVKLNWHLFLTGLPFQ